MYLPINLDKTFDKNNNISTKQPISHSNIQSSLQISNNNNTTYALNPDYINIATNKEKKYKNFKYNSQK